MVRGFVYSILSVTVFLLGSIIWMTTQPQQEDTLAYIAGWLILICFFGIGPLFFAIGYWHNMRLRPKDPHWDAETGD